MAGERSRGGRARAEEALVRVALLAGNNIDEIVVIGGLNADYLATNAPLPHEGTTDIDMLLEVGVAFDRDDLDFAWLDELLSQGKFESRSAGGWEWDALYGDTRVRLQFLCDDRSRAGQDIALPGASRVAARSFAGPGVMLKDPVARSVPVPDSLRAEFPEAPGAVELRFASLGGYIIAKAFAWESSGGKREKAAYDLLYVILHCEGGPRAAAQAVFTVQLNPTQQFDRARALATLSNFVDPGGVPAALYARAMAATGDGEQTLRNDAAFGVRAFLDRVAQLERNGAGESPEQNPQPPAPTG